MANAKAHVTHADFYDILSTMSTFYKLLAASLLAITANNFAWFALTYWAFLTTKSVVATSTMAGIFLVMAVVSGTWFGSVVDHNKKKHVMLASSTVTLGLFALALAYFRFTPESAFASVGSARLWGFVVIILFGTLSGTIYNIAIPTLVGLIVPEDMRARANGMFGMVSGIAFGITSIGSGLVLAYGGMGWVLRVAVAATAVAIVAVWSISVPERPIPRVAGESALKKLDLKETIAAVRSIPGLFALIFFTTFNNCVGGVFFALMDAYGLTLVSVQV